MGAAARFDFQYLDHNAVLRARGEPTMTPASAWRSAAVRHNYLNLAGRDAWT